MAQDVDIMFKFNIDIPPGNVLRASYPSSGVCVPLMLSVKERYNRMEVDAVDSVDTNANIPAAGK